jgi:hypothetical protein
MVVRPFLGIPSPLEMPVDVFVAMALAPETRSLYDVAIKPAVESEGLIVARADDFYGSKHVISDIWSAICGCRLIISDCTEHNPNVFYEIGIAHAIGREVIILLESNHEPPFDISHLRFLAYKRSEAGFERLRHDLKRVLQQATTQDGDSPSTKPTGGAT